MSIAHAKNKDIISNFKDGFAQTELLAGVYPGIRHYRCVLKEGCTVTPETYKKSLQVLCLTNGEGYITTPKKAFSINELSFFIANLDEEFTIHAVTDLVFTKFVVDLTDHDMDVYNNTHLVLPFFRPLSTANEYYQSCKTDNTRSWSIVVGKQLTRILFGVVKCEDGGTTEKGHPAVAQWNVILDDSDIVLTVDGESVNQESGDFSYVPAGLDHSLISKPGKKLNYIWFEHYVQEVDYIVTNPHR
jgi:hypothetical protein